MWAYYSEIHLESGFSSRSNRLESPKRVGKSGLKSRSPRITIT